MFPTPAILDWSSRNDFSGAVRPAAISPSASGVNVVRERLDPEPLEAGRKVGVVDQERLAEAARVGEPQLAAVVEQEAGAQVTLRGRALVLVQTPPLGGVELLLPLDQDQVAGHPQVHDQGLGAVERQQQVLAAPPQALDRPPADRRAQLGRRHRPRPALVEHLQPLDPLPGQLGLELAADRLDLGQLGHPPVLPEPRSSGLACC